MLSWKRLWEVVKFAASGMYLLVCHFLSFPDNSLNRIWIYHLGPSDTFRIWPLSQKKKKNFKGAIHPYGEMEEKNVSSCLYHLYSEKYLNLLLTWAFSGIELTCLIISWLSCVGMVWAAHLLMTHCNYWLLLNPSGQHHCVTSPSLDHTAFVIYVFAYLSTFMEMCFLLSVFTREKPRLSDSSEDHSSFRVCLGPAVWVRVEGQWGTDNVLVPEKLICG